MRLHWAVAAMLVFSACGNFSYPAECESIRCTAGRCVIENGTPTCLCGAWEQASGLTCYTLDIAHPADDTMEQAVPITPNVSVDGVLGSSVYTSYADADWFKFQPVPGAYYSLAFVHDEGIAGATARLVAPDGATLPQPAYQPPDPCYVEVNSSSRRALGRYTLTLVQQ